MGKLTVAVGKPTVSIEHGNKRPSVEMTEGRIATRLSSGSEVRRAFPGCDASTVRAVSPRFAGLVTDAFKPYRLTAGMSPGMRSAARGWSSDCRARPP
jgi:hypothetical protein